MSAVRNTGGLELAAQSEDDIFIDEVREHLSRTQLAWVESDGARELIVPGHRPIADAASADEPPAFYEEVTTLLLSYLLNRFRVSVFYDVGADRGYFSRLAASYQGSEVRSHAFEMRPEAIARMRHAADQDPLFRSIEIHHIGLTSEHRGESVIWYARTHMFELRPARKDYREGIGRELRNAIWPNRSRKLTTAKIELTSIDAFSHKHQTAPDVIKIDVEGYESAVIAGAFETMTRQHPFILLELHKDKKMRFGLTRAEVVNLALSRGYRALFLTDHHNRKACRVVPVDRNHPLLARQETDLLLLYHPQRLSTRRSPA